MSNKTETLPLSWTPPCSMVRIIAHWSEGRVKANDTDRAHYHLLVEGGASPRLVRGDHSIADNASTADGVYAAHTRGCNTGSIGIALCGMMGCQESPFSPGPEPITEAQWHLLVETIAVLCQRYNIPVTGQTVLCHGEVQQHLRIPQRGKWDPMRWPWAPEVPGHEIGDRLRQQVRDAIMSGQSQQSKLSAPPVGRGVLLAGKTFGVPQVRVEDGDTYLALRPACEHLGWPILSVGKSSAQVVNSSGETVELALDLEGGVGYVLVRDLAQVLGGTVRWEPKSKLVSVQVPASERKEL